MITTIQCEEGKIWDPQYSKCVTALSIVFCDDDSEYNIYTGLCQSFLSKVECVPGYSWSVSNNICVNNPIISPTLPPQPSVSPAISPSVSTTTPSSSPKIYTKNTTDNSENNTMATATPSATVAPSVSSLPLPSILSSPLPPSTPIISTSLLFRIPANGTLTKASFSDSILLAIAQSAATVLDLPDAAVRITGVEPVTVAQLAAVTNSTRRRLLGARFLQNIVGYRIILGIDAIAILNSSVITNLGGNGGSLSINNLGQIANAVSTTISLVTSTLLTNLVNSSSSIITALGYTSSSQFFNSITIDPTYPTIAVPGSSSTTIVASTDNNNLSGGAIAGIIIGLLIGVIVISTVYLRMKKGIPTNNNKDIPMTTILMMNNSNIAGSGSETRKVDYVNPMLKR